jgi:DNA-binding MarR family transcriptional regulator
MSEPPLSVDELRLWHALKRAGEDVMSKVELDLSRSAGLSGPDFGVLSRLVDLGEGALRQSDLAESMRWHKSRLSHQLSRMARRKLLRRVDAEGGGVRIEITLQGRKAIAAARVVHAQSVRRHLTCRLAAQDRRVLLAALESLIRES